MYCLLFLFFFWRIWIILELCLLYRKTREIGLTVGNLLDVPTDPNWQTTFQRISTHPYDKLSYLLLRLALQTTIYHVWRERNDRKHSQVYHLVSHLFRVIEKSVRNIEWSYFVTKITWGSNHFSNGGFGLEFSDVMIHTLYITLFVD